MALRKLVSVWLAMLALLQYRSSWAVIALLAAMHWSKLPVAVWLLGDVQVYDEGRVGRIGLALTVVFAVAVMMAHLLLSRTLVSRNSDQMAGGAWLGLWVAMQLGAVLLGAALGWLFRSVSPAFAYTALAQAIASALALWPFFLPMVWATALACGETAWGMGEIAGRLRPALLFWLVGFVPVCALTAIPAQMIVTYLFGGVPANDYQAPSGQLLQALLSTFAALLPLFFALAAWRSLSDAPSTAGEIFA